MQYGIGPSVGHFENGMPRSDMEACILSAAALDEIIVFRSTGPWSKRWLSATPPYPSKNFHVKGKSSDWGPQAGFVPHLGIYSKVGNNAAKAAAGTRLNNDGIASGFADKAPLSLTRAEIQMQFSETCESPPRTAVFELKEFADDGVILLGCFRSGDRMRFNFVCRKKSGRNQYDVMLPPPGPIWGHWDTLVDRMTTGKLDAAMLAKLEPLEVMVSKEVGAGNRAMTGDYDLMAICPRWGDYMARSSVEISKDAIVLANPVHGHTPHGLVYKPGAALDKVLDMRLHTGHSAKTRDQAKLPVDGKSNVAFQEHGDMGNLTPRILRAINTLNIDMGAVGPNSALRRVHHNAESHRHGAFGALTSRDMDGGEGFPLTAFHPPSALANLKPDPSEPGKVRVSPLLKYGSVCTIERMTEFKIYAGDVHAAGFFVPKHWAWNMSIRNAGHA